MLQGVQPQSHEVGSIGDTDNAENATFLFQFVIVEGMGGGHGMGQEWQLRIQYVGLLLLNLSAPRMSRTYRGKQGRDVRCCATAALSGLTRAPHRTRQAARTTSAPGREVT